MERFPGGRNTRLPQVSDAAGLCGCLSVNRLLFQPALLQKITPPPLSPPPHLSLSWRDVEMRPPPTLDLAGSSLGWRKREISAHTNTCTPLHTHTHTARTHMSEENLETVQVFLFSDLLFILTVLNFNSSPAVFMDSGEIFLSPSCFFEGLKHKYRGPGLLFG